MGRAPCCDKANVKKGPWSPEEDAKLKEYIHKNGTGGNWIALPHKVGLRRCGKSCRLRWLNYLRPNIKHGEFSDDEDRIICSLFASIGSRWSIIAGQLPGRTDNDIKNYWNTKLKKKLMAAAAAAAPTATTTTQYQTRPHPATVYPSPPNNSLFQEPSLSPHFPSDCYNPSIIRAFQNIYEPVSPTPFITPIPFGPDGFPGPARDNICDDKNGLFILGPDRPDFCSRGFLIPSGAADGGGDEGGKFFSGVHHRGYSSSSSSSSAALNEGYGFGDNPLDYEGIEEIKQLISSNPGCGNSSGFLLVDEIIGAVEN